MQMRRTTLTLMAVAALGAAAAAQTRTAPTVDQILSLERVGTPEISPDGRLVLYTVRRTNWDENAYETQIWLAPVTRGSPSLRASPPAPRPALARRAKPPPSGRSLSRSARARRAPRSARRAGARRRRRGTPGRRRTWGGSRSGR